MKNILLDQYIILFDIHIYNILYNAGINIKNCFDD